MNYLLARLEEPSTYRGLVLLATTFGMQVAPEAADAVVAIGLLLAGLIGVFVPDKVKEDA
jgi:hypothetical protein